MRHQIQPGSEPVQHRQAARLSLEKSVFLGALPVPLLDGITEQLLRSVHQRRLIRQHSPQLEGKRQHVLPHVHVGKHAVHKVRRTVCHRTAGATWAELPRLARKANDVIVKAGFAPEAREARTTEATIHATAPRARDEGWHRASLMLQGSQEFTEVLAHHLVENGQFRRVAGMRHAACGKREAYRASALLSGLLLKKPLHGLHTVAFRNTALAAASTKPPRPWGWPPSRHPRAAGGGGRAGTGGRARRGQAGPAARVRRPQPPPGAQSVTVMTLALGATKPPSGQQLVACPSVCGEARRGCALVIKVQHLLTCPGAGLPKKAISHQERLPRCLPIGAGSFSSWIARTTRKPARRTLGTTSSGRQKAGHFHRKGGFSCTSRPRPSTTNCLRHWTWCGPMSGASRASSCRLRRLSATWSC